MYKFIIILQILKIPIEDIRICVSILQFYNCDLSQHSAQYYIYNCINITL